MKNLLLISNISADNKHLVEYAAHFCKHYNCKLHFLHIAENNLPVLVSSPYYYKEFNIQYEKSQVANILKKVSDATTDIIESELVHVTIQKGNQDLILKKFVNANFIDMIMLGNVDLERDSDFKEHRNILMNVIDTPLIIVPEFMKFKPFKKLNFLTRYTEKDIEHIIRLSVLFNKCKIKVSHAAGNDTTPGTKADNWLSYLTSKVPGRIEHQVIEEDIDDYIRRKSFAVHKFNDAFVFTSYKRNFWTRLLDPSTTLSYLSTMEVPSIVFKIER